MATVTWGVKMGCLENDRKS